MPLSKNRKYPLKFKKTKTLQNKSHILIPGGCHTYAKGDDQYPELSPGFIVRGEGCRVWDVDGNEFIEYGMGGRSVTLGHAFPPVIKAAGEELLRGSSFTRPSHLEVKTAEELLSIVPGADMVKFTKDGSTATTAAVKLARAYTGRDLVALCADHPFFSYDDWFIGTTEIDAGIPVSINEMSLTFRYNDPDSVRALFDRYPGRIAALILEPVKYDHPQNNFLHEVKALCAKHGTVFILDEMITGFRIANGGGQEYYDIEADLSAYGKGMSNGFALSALAGKKELMELGGLYHDRERVFLLSTTHGAETHALAAAAAVMQVYKTEPVISYLDRIGRRLSSGLKKVITAMGLEDYVGIIGLPSNLVFTTKDRDGKPSQLYRSLFLQEIIKGGILGPSLVVSYSHTDRDIDITISAFAKALKVYQKALEDGAERYLTGAPSKIVYRRFN